MRTARSEQAALRGDRVLTLSEDLPDAMRALRQARHEVVGEPLRGVLTPETQDCTTATSRRWLRKGSHHAESTLGSGCEPSHT